MRIRVMRIHMTLTHIDNVDTEYALIKARSMIDDIDSIYLNMCLIRNTSLTIIYNSYEY